MSQINRRRFFDICLAIAVLPGMLLGACTPVEPTPDPCNLTVASASSMLPLAELVSGSFSSRHPDVRLSVDNARSSEAAIFNVLSGKADLALTTVQPSYFGHGDLFSQAIGKEPFFIVVHPGNRQDHLSTSEANALFTGKIGEWSSLGPTDGPVQVMTRERDTGTRNVLTHALLKDGTLTPTALVKPGSELMQQSIAQDPQAIGYLAGGWLDPSVKPMTIDGMSPEFAFRQPDQYPLTVPVYLVFPDDHAADAATLLAFLRSQEGQKLMRNRFFLVGQQP
ncbi:MAG: substrate-binding domain-containing protein [Chloroflexota bacterium]|nr:substrate-binding domain-containing protein [Chloroflexota bacterium]